MFSKQDCRQPMIEEYWSTTYRLSVLPFISQCELLQLKKFVYLPSNYSLTLQKMIEN